MNRHRFAALGLALLLSCVPARGAGAQEAAVAPPAEAYLAVLRHVADALRRQSPGVRIAVSTRHLPASVPDERLRELGMFRTGPLCAGAPIVIFEPAERQEDTFTLRVLAGPTNTFLVPSVFSVRCADGECHARWSPGPTSDYMIAC
jgi:hypothetical protein